MRKTEIAPPMIGNRPTSEVVRQAILNALDRSDDYFLFTIKAFAGQEIANEARAAFQLLYNPEWNYHRMVEDGIGPLPESGEIAPIESWYAENRESPDHRRFRRVGLLERLDAP